MITRTNKVLNNVPSEEVIMDRKSIVQTFSEKDFNSRKDLFASFHDDSGEISSTSERKSDLEIFVEEELIGRIDCESPRVGKGLEKVIFLMEIMIDWSIKDSLCSIWIKYISDECLVPLMRIREEKISHRS